MAGLDAVEGVILIEGVGPVGVDDKNTARRTGDWLTNACGQAIDGLHDKRIVIWIAVIRQHACTRGSVDSVTLENAYRFIRPGGLGIGHIPSE